jgi:hypothetical protein
MVGSTSHGAERGDTGIALFAACLLYAMLRQETFYSADGFGLLIAARKEDLMLPHHVLYLPILAIARSMASSLYGAASWLSVVGAGAGVALSHAAFVRLGWSRMSAALATCVVATAPAVVFFATVVELHGLHFGSCGATWLAIAWFARKPSAAAGLAIGVATAIGYLGHGTGLLLPIVALPFAAILAKDRGADARTLPLPLGLSLASHVAVVAVSNALLRVVEPGVSVDGAAQYAIGQHGALVLAQPLLVLHSVLHDWLFPFFVTSAISLYGIMVPSSRLLAISLWCAVGCYAAVTAVLMGDGTEHGAYLVPLIWPAAVVAVRAIPSVRMLSAAIAVSAAFAIWGVVSHDVGEDRNFAAGYRRVVAERPAILVVGSHRELAPLLLDEPYAEWLVVSEVMALAGAESALLWVENWVHATQRAGRDVLLTEGTLRWLADPSSLGGGELGGRLLSHLRAAFSFELVADGSFAASRLHPLAAHPSVPVDRPR